MTRCWELTAKPAKNAKKTFFEDAIIELMNKLDLRFYVRSRWKAVEEIERKELRAAAIAKNWREQYERRVYAIAHGIDPEKMEIWARRAKLIELYESGVWSGRPKDE